MEQILAILVPFFLGLWGYFHRADMERRRSLHVDRGVDEVVNEIEAVLAEYAQNWSLSLRALKTFRFIPQYLTGDFLGQFSEVDHSRMKMASARRLSKLVGSDSIWSYYQLCFSFAGTRSQIIMYELIPALIENLDAEEEVRQKILEHAEKILMEMQDLYHAFYEALNSLCVIKDNLDEVTYFTKGAVIDFSMRSDVRNAVAEIEAFVASYETWEEPVNASEGAQRPAPTAC